MHRLLAPAVALAATVASLAVATPAHGAPSAAPNRSTGGEVTVRGDAFSPNGDGVGDRARIRFTLPSASTVSLRVTRWNRDRPVRRVDLGRLSAGRHVWTWDGRAAGRTVSPGYYGVELRTSSGTAEGLVHVDVEFTGDVSLTETYGQPRSAVPRVYPRTRAVRDAVGLTARVDNGEETPRRAVLRVRDADGRTVARRDLVARPTGYQDEDGWWRADPLVWDARDRRGRPLAPGRYTATVGGTDAAGNRGTSRPLTIRVSDRRLEWVEESRRLLPRDVSHGSVCGTWSSGNGCGDGAPCGPVLQSALFPGGLSHRGVEHESCASVLGGPGSESHNWFEVPQAVRGIAAARVAFTGAPTHAGEPDTGTVSTYSYESRSGMSATSATGASTGWVAQPWGGLGSSGDPDRGEPRMLPSVVWSFSTSGTDSFDVASYTVDLRYLAVAD